MVGVGIRNRPGAEAWLFATAGNPAFDPKLDCWSVATHDRVGREGKVVRAGEAYLEQWGWTSPGRWGRFLKLVL